MASIGLMNLPVVHVTTPEMGRLRSGIANAILLPEKAVEVGQFVLIVDSAVQFKETGLPDFVTAVIGAISPASRHGETAVSLIDIKTPLTST